MAGPAAFGVDDAVVAMLTSRLPLGEITALRGILGLALARARGG